MNNGKDYFRHLPPTLDEVFQHGQRCAKAPGNEPLIPYSPRCKLLIQTYIEGWESIRPWPYKVRK